MPTGALVLEWVPLRESRRLPAVPGIYVIRHVETLMEYVGQSKNVRERAASHRSARAWHYFGRALRAHGLDKFEVCLLAEGSVEDLGRLEQEAIAARGSLAPAGYNLSAGGDGPTGVLWSDERRAAQTARLLGKKHTPEAIESMRQARLASNPFKGRKHSAEARAKIGAATVAVHTGMKRSDETKARISASLMGRAAPYISPEVRERVAATRRGKKFPGTGLAGEKNPMYGIRGGRHARAKPVACWCSNGVLPYQVFDSAAEAASWASVKVSSISDWCAGRYRDRSGLLWAYL